MIKRGISPDEIEEDLKVGVPTVIAEAIANWPELEFAWKVAQRIPRRRFP